MYEMRRFIHNKIIKANIERTILYVCTHYTLKQTIFLNALYEMADSTHE